MTKLVVDFCSYQAAKYAVEHWHYSGCMPRSKLNHVGVWENGLFIGAVVFGYGATPQIGSPYKLKQNEIIELTRVALNNHRCNVTQILSKSIRLIKWKNYKLRLIVSFADYEQNHHGGIYQAGNWVYTGTTKPSRVGFIIHGKKVHNRTVGLKPNGVQSIDWVKNNLDINAIEWYSIKKFRYLYPLDKAMRRQVSKLAQPYPKREEDEHAND